MSQRRPAAAGTSRRCRSGASAAAPGGGSGGPARRASGVAADKSHLPLYHAWGSFEVEQANYLPRATSTSAASGRHATTASVSLWTAWALLEDRAGAAGLSRSCCARPSRDRFAVDVRIVWASPRRGSATWLRHGSSSRALSADPSSPVVVSIRGHGACQRFRCRRAYCQRGLAAELPSAAGGVFQHAGRCGCSACSAVGDDRSVQQGPCHRSSGRGGLGAPAGSRPSLSQQGSGKAWRWAKRLASRRCVRPSSWLRRRA